MREPKSCQIGVTQIFTVSGPAEHITRFREAIHGSDDNGEIPFDFNQLIPMPSELGETCHDFGKAYDVYYGDAEPMLGYPWVKNLGIETVDQLREHFDADPKHRATADEWKANIEKYGAPTCMNGVASIGARNGMRVTPK